ncbi:MAG: class I adenylate-forming enzyme family protein [Candidatus Dormibacteria bacterium]
MRPAPRSRPAIEAGDVIAVRLPAGPQWSDHLGIAWDSGAALLPLDVRMPEAEMGALLSRGRPTLLVDGRGWHRLPGGVRGDGSVGLIMATSGARGEPALVELERRAVEHAVHASARRLNSGAGDGWLACLPPSHIGGLLVLLRGLLLGAPVIIHEGFHPAALAGAVGSASFISLVPTMLARLLDAGVDLSRFRAVLVGGAAIDARLETRVRERSVAAVPTYGQTQSCGGVVYAGLALEGVEAGIGVAGEVELGGATLMRGYRLDQARTAAAFTAGGRLRTGDAGHIDAEGLLHIEGRLDDLIITGGEKVWPAEVEAVLIDHPGVVEAMVTGVPDAEWGMRVIAHIVPREPSAPPTLEQLREHVGERLARFKAPTRLVLTATLARTSLGKARRR